MNSSASGIQIPQMELAWLCPRLFVVAVLINYIWEIAQSPLYVGMEDFNLVWWHCGLAALGDGLLVLLIYVAGWAVLRRRDWFVHPGGIGCALILLAGFVIGVSVEWLAVFIGNRWEYTARMPLVPLLGVGLAPVAQMLVLPLLTFRIIAIWHGHSTARHTF
jgi:hypothetical protein